MQIPSDVNDALAVRELHGDTRKNWIISAWLDAATNTHEARVIALMKAAKRMRQWAARQSRQEVRA